MTREFRLNLAALLIVITAVLLAFGSLKDDAPTLDEVPHIGAGFSYLTKHNMRLNPEHPPLAKDLAAFPLLFLHLDDTAFSLPYWTGSYHLKREYGQWEIGRALLYDSGVDGDKVKTVARLPMLLFFIGAAWYLFKWLCERSGSGAALIGVTLFAFSPTVLAHARLVTTDVPALFGVIFASYYFVRYWSAPSRGRFIIAALALGVGLSTKFSAVLLILAFIISAITIAAAKNEKYFSRRLYNMIIALVKTAALSALAFIIVVWPLYAFNMYGYPSSQQKQDTADIEAYLRPTTATKIALYLSDKPVLRFAGHYLLGLEMANQRAEGGNQIFFRGYVTDTGGPIYFPFVYLIKETLAWWILVLIAVFTAMRRIFNFQFSIFKPRTWIQTHIPETVMLVWLVVYWAVSIQSPLNLGVRHILPVFSFTIMLVAGQLSSLVQIAKIKTQSYPLRQSFSEASSSKSKIFNPIRYSLLAIGLLLAWHIVEAFIAYPNYIPYFNELVGGSKNGRNYVTDSNLDWGQGISHLGRWMRERGVEHIDLDVFTWADRDLYIGKDRYSWISADTYSSADDFLSRNQSDGWIAISATFYQEAISPSKTNPNKEIKYAWLLPYKPVEIVGNSILVWHIQ